MVNEDILTSLKNAIEHGEPLDYAKKVLINSGYNPREVEEASIFIGRGVSFNLQERPDDINIQKIPSKSFFSRFTKQPIIDKTEDFYLQESIKEDADKIKNEISPIIKPSNSNASLSIPVPSYNEGETKEIREIKPPKKYFKEIVLLIILLFLIGILITTLLFKNTILKFFSGV